MNLDAGRDLDELISIHVFKNKPFYALITTDFSTEIDAAWRILERIPMTIYAPNAPFADGEYKNTGDWKDSTRTWRAEAKRIGREDFSDSVTAYGLTAPHAICLAALKAVGKLES